MCHSWEHRGGGGAVEKVYCWIHHTESRPCGYAGRMTISQSVMTRLSTRDLYLSDCLLCSKGEGMVFPCTICGAKLPSKVKLAKHFQDLHQRERTKKLSGRTPKQRERFLADTRRNGRLAMLSSLPTPGGHPRRLLSANAGLC